MHQICWDLGYQQLKIVYSVNWDRYISSSSVNYQRSQWWWVARRGGCFRAHITHTHRHEHMAHKQLVNQSSDDGSSQFVVPKTIAVAPLLHARTLLVNFHRALNAFVMQTNSTQRMIKWCFTHLPLGLLFGCMSESDGCYARPMLYTDGTGEKGSVRFSSLHCSLRLFMTRLNVFSVHKLWHKIIYFN